MTMRTISAELEGDGLRLVARTDSGHLIIMEDADGDTHRRAAGGAPRGRSGGLHGDGRRVDPAQEATNIHALSRSGDRRATTRCCGFGWCRMWPEPFYLNAYPATRSSLEADEYRQVESGPDRSRPMVFGGPPGIGPSPPRSQHTDGIDVAPRPGFERADAINIRIWASVRRWCAGTSGAGPSGDTGSTSRSGIGITTSLGR